jgi:hypothetical protein
MRGDAAVLVSNVAGQDEAPRFRQEVERQLRQAKIFPTTIRAPIFDLYATTEKILEVLRSNRDEHLYFNASSGSKIQSLSGYIASNLARSEGIHVESYYAEPESYAPTRGQPLSRGFVRAFYIPALTVRTPEPLLRSAMELLHQRPLSKLDLALRLARQDLLTARLTGEGRPQDDAARVSLQTAVDTKVIRPLLGWRFVDTQRVGRHVRVSLTPEGAQALRLYRSSGSSAQ